MLSLRSQNNLRVSLCCVSHFYIVRLSVFMLSADMLNVIKACVVAPFKLKLSIGGIAVYITVA
jgi:hypothetical protein